MDNATAVDVVYDLKQLIDQIGNQLLSHERILNLFIQLPTVHFLHHNQDLILFLEHFLDLNNPRMPYSPSNLDFFPEKDHFLSRHRLFAYNFNGCNLISDLALALINLRKLTATKFPS